VTEFNILCALAREDGRVMDKTVWQSIQCPLTRFDRESQ